MPMEAPPSPETRVALEIKGIPVRLWWKLMEEAQKQGVSVNYLVFRILVQAVDYEINGESYDLVVQEMVTQLSDCADEKTE